MARGKEAVAGTLWQEGNKTVAMRRFRGKDSDESVRTRRPWQGVYGEDTVGTRLWEGDRGDEETVARIP